MTIWSPKKIDHAQTLERGQSLQASAQSLRAMLSFVAFAFAWSWGLGFAAVQAKAYAGPLNTVLLIAAGFGPSLAGFVTVSLFSSRGGCLAWLARCFNWRVDWRWYALVFLMPPAVMIAVRASNAALGGAIPAFPAASEILPVIANFGLGLLVGGPLGEEFGWRGYAMAAMTGKVHWVVAALIVGAVWGLWHLPLFFMTGTVQSHMQIAPFMLSIVASSVLFGWLFERTQRSVLPAIALHASVNAWSAILVLPVTATIRPYALVTTLVVAFVAVMLALASPRPGQSSKATTDTPC